MKYLFASDVHLGLDIDERGDERKERFISFLQYAHDQLKEGGALFLLGDIFDFWFEYRSTRPRGFDSIISQLRKITDDGIPVHFFKGNHDMWMVGHLERESGVVVHDGPREFTLFGKRLLLSHGDYLGVNLWRYPLYALMHAAFTSRGVYGFSRVVLPQSVMESIGKGWSRKSRKSKRIAHTFKEEGEPLVRYSRGYLKKRDIDYFIYGHLHCPTRYPLSDRSALYILGEWIVGATYLLFEEGCEPRFISYK